jgi:PII-like signaling protein
MLTAGPARKVTIHVSENHKYHGQSAYAAILDFLFYRGVSGATVVRGIAGFGADHHMQPTFPSRSNSLSRRKKWKSFCPSCRKWPAPA